MENEVLVSEKNTKQYIVVKMIRNFLNTHQLCR